MIWKVLVDLLVYDKAKKWFSGNQGPSCIFLNIATPDEIFMFSNAARRRISGPFGLKGGKKVAKTKKMVSCQIKGHFQVKMATEAPKSGHPKSHSPFSILSFFDAARRRVSGTNFGFVGVKKIRKIRPKWHFFRKTTPPLKKTRSYDHVFLWGERAMFGGS